jgi:hypothetical protein
MKVPPLPKRARFAHPKNPGGRLEHSPRPGLARSAQVYKPNVVGRDKEAEEECGKE